MVVIAYTTSVPSAAHRLVIRFCTFQSTKEEANVKRLKLDKLLQNQATQIFRGPSTSSGPPVNNLPPITSDTTPDQREWFARHYENTAKVVESVAYS